MRHALRSSSIVVWSLLFAAGTAWGQATAQLNGVVKDESGAVLPGVTITASQSDTGFTRTVVSDETGAWVMPNLPVGPYRLEVALQGFRTYVQTGIVLQVNANVVINASLSLGNLEESVIVGAAAPLVDVKSAGLRDVVDQARIVELPLNGRNVTDLIVLAGSAVNTGRVSALSGTNSVGISVAGGLRSGVEYVLDGAAYNSPHDNGNLPFPFPDALQEFGVSTGGLAASTGMHSGASVNAVTKSGTNVFHGNVFEFLRDSRFNAAGAFAPIGADGSKKTDGLNRNVFGGTAGGPLVRDRLFFFFGYEHQRIRQTTPDNLAFVPTPAMLSGDFTSYASPACNGGRQVTLGAPFVNNRVDPLRFSPAALRVANSGWLPTSTDPCGAVQYGVNFDNNNDQYVSRVDYQRSAGHSIFGRYIDTLERRPPMLAQLHNIMTIQANYLPYRNRRAQTFVVGDTRVLSNNTVNAFHASFDVTKTRANDPPETFFDASGLGIPGIYTYVPGTVTFVVQPAGFQFSGNHTVAAKIDTKVYQIADDFSRVWGRHQLAVGANLVYSWFDGWDYAGSNGTFTFNGRATGLVLSDFLTGQMSSFGQGAPNINYNHQWYVGVYGQDAWRVSERVTLNLGLRWDPYLGTQWQQGTITNFSLSNYANGIVSTQFVNAPPGLLFPGDAGFPPGMSGVYKRLGNPSPRVGVAWDVKGDGRTALRSSYAINYDFPGQAFQQPAANVTPFNPRVSLSGNIPLDNPYQGVAASAVPVYPVPSPIPSNVAFPNSAQYTSIDPYINSIRSQSWNVTIERQLGASWQWSASYLGSYLDRIWGQGAVNPGVYMGLGPCTIAGVSYTVCSTTANLAARRLLSLQNPTAGRLLSDVWMYSSIGEQLYRGLKLSVTRRSGKGLSVNGNYTVSRCLTDAPYNGLFISQFEFTKPLDPKWDTGHCPFNQRQIANVTVGAQSPRFDNGVLRTVASDWRASGIFGAHTGNWLTVITSRDILLTGLINQRVNQVSADPYGARTLSNYLNPTAFAYPDTGTYGNEPARGIEGPGFWNIDMALARLLDAGGGKTIELRVEAFNLLNHVNWGDPGTNLDAATFGRITTQNGNSRILQFAVKYGF
jgi:Carboxypeptidase regulatory-like domain